MAGRRRVRAPVRKPRSRAAPRAEGSRLETSFPETGVYKALRDLVSLLEDIDEVIHRRSAA